LEIETRWMKRSDTDDAIRIMNSCGGGFDRRRVDRLVSKSGVVCVVAEVNPLAIEKRHSQGWVPSWSS